jgi:hypothetical protein
MPERLLGSVENLEACFRGFWRDWGHWNDGPPGEWVRLHTIAEVGSYVSRFCQPSCGVYRLVPFAEDDKVIRPKAIGRLCGEDKTGTLYIGRESYNFTERSRLSQLVRSVRGMSGNHLAGHYVRHQLSGRFPISRLAITWCYENRARIAERELFSCYRSSFGELPPLNDRSG